MRTGTSAPRLRGSVSASGLPNAWCAAMLMSALTPKPSPNLGESTRSSAPPLSRAGGFDWS